MFPYNLISSQTSSALQSAYASPRSYAKYARSHFDFEIRCTVQNKISNKKKMKNFLCTQCKYKCDSKGDKWNKTCVIKV